MELQRLSLDFDRRPPLLKPTTVLVTAAGASDIETLVQNLHPKHEQFPLLRKAYLATLADERVGTVTTRAVSSKSRKKRRVLRRRLAERLLINMEMWRWMPEKLGSRHIWANIPEYQVRVVNGDRIAHRTSHLLVDFEVAKVRAVGDFEAGDPRLQFA